MKKILVVLSCVALLLPLVVLSAFADDSSFYLVYPSGSSVNPASVEVDNVVYPITNDPRLISASFNSVLRLKASNILSLNGVALSVSSDSPTVVFPGDSIIVGASSSFTSYYIIFREPVDPFSSLNVGVDSSISFSGQVLSFLTSNSTTIVLIGLSVAMFAILPFAIRKIKQLIKGY